MMAVEGVHAIQRNGREVICALHSSARYCMTSWGGLSTAMPLITLHVFALNRAAASLLSVLLSAWSTDAYGAQDAVHRSTEVHLLAPSALHFAGISEPLAVTDAQPVFSWQLTAARPELHSVAQTAFRIQGFEV